MLGLDEIPAKQDGSVVATSTKFKTQHEEKKCKPLKPVLKSSLNITVTTLPILNKFPPSNTTDSNFRSLSKLLPNTCNSTLKNVKLPNQRNLSKYFPKEMASHNARHWPLAEESNRGFVPLGFRTRPTFGEQCLKSGNQWPVPREEPGPSLPYLDLFADDPTLGKCFVPVKNCVISKPVKRISSVKRNWFPALIDGYNLRNGLLNIGGNSDAIASDPARKEKDFSLSTNFPEVGSCNLDTYNLTQQEKDGLDKVSNFVRTAECSECPLCRQENELRAQARDESMSNSPRYHIRMPTTD